MAVGGLIRGEATLGEYRSAHGTTPEALEALCWLARGALADKLFDKASGYADEVRTRAAAAIRNDSVVNPKLLGALGAGIQVGAISLVERGARSEAVYVLRQALAEYGGTPISEQIQSNIDLLTLEGRAAPAIDAGVSIGSRLPRATGAAGGVQLLFFWAHWCQECKAESPILATIAARYRERGLAIVAPTRRYGYVEAGRLASPDRELRHIVQVRDSHYSFLKHAPVPVTDANYKAYGVAAVPMHVLIDRDGMVRLYQQGRMTEGELDAAIAAVLER
jgi:hypothetical protein